MKIYFPLVIMIILLGACQKPIPEEIYGTYYKYFDLSHETMVLYKRNIYSYHSSSPFNSDYDTGTFVYDKDTLYFTSIKLVEVESSKNSNQLTCIKCYYQNGKIYTIPLFISGDGTATHLTKLTP